MYCCLIKAAFNVKKKILIIITGMGIEAQIHFLIPSLCSLASSQMIVSLNVAKREEVE